MANTNDIAVKVQDLTKTFKIPIEASSGIKQKLINVLKGKKGYREFTPLNDISFEVKKGDFFGIVGRNGSGKSTLLKTIANIYTPTKGAVQVNGTLVPFIELGVGFNPELTGRENVFLNGALLGFSHKEMEAMYDDIVDFAEISDFMDEKLKNYSSGMQVRLAFSIAIKAEGDILLLDEVLAVGDEAFQRKCFNYFAQLKKEKKTVILVTHNMSSVQQFCTKAMMIDGGKIISIGSPKEAASEYRELFMGKEQKATEIKEASYKNNYVKISALNNIDYAKNTLKVEIDIIPKVDLFDPVVTIEIVKDNGEIIYRWVTDEKVEEKLFFHKNIRWNLKLNLDNIFPNGKFSIQVGVKKRDRSENYVMISEATVFEIINKGAHSGDTVWKPREDFIINNAK